MRARVALACIRLSEIALAGNDSKTAREYAQKAIEDGDSTYVRPWALAIGARTEENPSKAKDLYTEADAMLNAGTSVAHDHFHIRVLQMEDSLDRENWSAVDRAADKLEEFTKPEPLPWTDFHICRGRAIAAWGRGNGCEQTVERLADLRKIRADTGMKIWLPGDSQAD